MSGFKNGLLLPRFTCHILCQQWDYSREHYKCSPGYAYLSFMEACQTYAFFLDSSGSVGGRTQYWQTVSSVLTRYAPEVSHYYLWNSRCQLSSKEQFETSIALRRGTGLTNPEYVAQQILDKKFENIILVTDGEVKDDKVSLCDKILEGMKGPRIKRAVCYVISSVKEPNLSVTCPFTRFCESKVFSRRAKEVQKLVMHCSAEDHRLLHSLEEITLQTFQDNYSTLEKLIIAQNMGRDGSPELKNQLVTLKSRLVKELSKKLGKKGDYSQRVRAMLQSNDVAAALEMIANMATRYFEVSDTAKLEKKINYFISLCGDMRGQYSLDQIRSNKMATAQDAVEGKIDNTQQLSALSRYPISCPIIMDEDVPQILVDQCQPFLLGLEKCIVDDINACPLRILNYPQLKAKFRARLRQFTGVKFSDKERKNPFTRNKLLGAIPLGSHKSHVTVGNHTMAKMVSGGKVMGNLNLYFAVIWILISQDQIQFLKEIEANAAEHLLYRLKNSQTMASLCGLSQFCGTRVDSDIALWYCLNSGYLDNPTQKDTFRFHLYNIQPMLKISQLLGYPNDPGFERHYLRTLALHYFLQRYKNYDSAQRKCFNNLFKGLYQKGFLIQTANIDSRVRQLEVCTEFIPVDGTPDHHQLTAVRNRFPSFTHHMTNQDLLYVASFVNPDTQASEIQLPYNPLLPQLPLAQVNWKYGLKDYQQKVEIDAQTVRPKQVECRTGVLGMGEGELFKGCRYLCEFVVKYGKRPTRDELAVFYYNRYVQAGKKTTLPYLTEKWISELLASYHPIFTSMSIPQFVSVFRAGLKHTGSSLRSSAEVAAVSAGHT